MNTVSAIRSASSALEARAAAATLKAGASGRTRNRVRRVLKSTLLAIAQAERDAAAKAKRSEAARKAAATRAARKAEQEATPAPVTKTVSRRAKRKTIESAALAA